MNHGFCVVYNRTDGNGKSVPRKWVTIECVDYNDVKAIYCTLFITLSTSNVLSNYCSGCTNFKNIYAAIESHEKSLDHSLAVEAYFSASSQNSIEFSMSRNMMNCRKELVMECCHVLEQVFDIIKLIGKQNLSYRGSSKVLYNIDNSNFNHGNFLELLKFTAKRDIILNKYLTDAI